MCTFKVKAVCLEMCWLQQQGTTLTQKVNVLRFQVVPHFSKFHYSSESRWREHLPCKLLVTMVMFNYGYLEQITSLSTQGCQGVADVFQACLTEDLVTCELTLIITHNLKKKTKTKKNKYTVTESIPSTLRAVMGIIDLYLIAREIKWCRGKSSL